MYLLEGTAERGRNTHIQSGREITKQKQKGARRKRGPAPLATCRWLQTSRLATLRLHLQGADMASKPVMKQGKPAAQLQDPIPMEGKCATGTRTARGKGGDRAKKVRRWGWSSLTHNTTHTSDCSRTLSHTPHLYSTCLTVLRPRWAQHHARAHRSARGGKDRGSRSATSVHASSE